MIVRVTHADPKLPHQIVLLQGVKRGDVDISCNCLQLTSTGGHKAMGTVSYDAGVPDIWDIYDNPFNHNNVGRENFEPGQRGEKEWEIVW